MIISHSTFSTIHKSPLLIKKVIGAICIIFAVVLFHNLSKSEVKIMQLDPEFVEIEARQLVALSRQFTMETRNEIPGLWHDFWSQEWQLAGEEEQVAYGVSYAMTPDGGFFYAAARNITPLPENLPEDACIVTLAAGQYAVFRNKGPVTEIPTLFDEIFSSWLPNSGKTQREGAVFERYPYDENASPESMVYEIWVPVEV